MHTLYISYFGIREFLVSTQVLPYLRQLHAGGIGVDLLTFEPNLGRWSEAERAQWKDRLASDGIRWHCLPYHKRPSLPATLYDIAVGAWYSRRLVLQHEIDVLHGRALVASVIGGIAKRLTKRKLIFDIRGLNCEEYVDAGVWRREGLKHRLAKAMESWAFRVADGFVILTERARSELFAGSAHQDERGRPVEVIPCCVDLQRFATGGDVSRDEAKAALGFAGSPVVAYIGALGGIYLTREMAEFCAVAHELDPSVRFLFLTTSPAALIVEPLRQLGIPERNVLVRPVGPEEVPRYLRAADLALSFRKPSYSQIAASPTKIAEYLATGIPVLSNAGIGDVDEFVEADRVGVILRQFDGPAFRAAYRALEAMRHDPETPARCMASARRRFDLEAVGGVRYRRLYARLNGSDGKRAAGAMAR